MILFNMSLTYILKECFYAVEYIKPFFYNTLRTIGIIGMIPLIIFTLIGIASFVQDVSDYKNKRYENFQKLDLIWTIKLMLMCSIVGILLIIVNVEFIKNPFFIMTLFKKYYLQIVLGIILLISINKVNILNKRS